jgi:hypothetical protein
VEENETRKVGSGTAVLRNGRRAVPKVIGGRLRRWLRWALSELAMAIERTGKIVVRARSRLAG